MKNQYVTSIAHFIRKRNEAVLCFVSVSVIIFYFCIISVLNSLE